jgi:hypothetical protein
MGRIAGLLSHAVEPLAFTGLSYAFGKMSGQSDQQALLEALGGVGGAYGVQHAAEKVFPQAKVKLPFQSMKDDHYLNYAGIGGSVLGGYAGAQVGDAIYHATGGVDQGESLNPALYAVDEAAMPFIQIAKGFV